MSSKKDRQISYNPEKPRQKPASPPKKRRNISPLLGPIITIRAA